MSDEDAFVQAMLATPQDDDLRLVYADWLEERGELAKTEFLRLTVQVEDTARSKGERRADRKRLRTLAADLDTGWLAVVSRLRIENCQGKRQEAESRRVYSVRFDYLCDRGWQDLQTTDKQAVRYCDDCKKNVHYCDTIMQARAHAQAGNCIAVDLGIVRKEGDLEPQRMWLGMPSQETLQAEEERVKPDPVSAERERRKRKMAERARGTSSNVQTPQ